MIQIQALYQNFPRVPSKNTMTLCDASNKTTFVFDNLKEGSKYYFAAKARNTAGESEFSAVANRWMY